MLTIPESGPVSVSHPHDPYARLTSGLFRVRQSHLGPLSRLPNRLRVTQSPEPHPFPRLRPYSPILTFLVYGPPRWPSGYGIRLESGRSRVRVPLAPGFFSASSHTSDFKIGTPVPTLPGAWSVLGLVGPVSVYCDRVRWKV